MLTYVHFVLATVKLGRISQIFFFHYATWTIAEEFYFARDSTLTIQMWWRERLTACVTHCQHSIARSGLGHAHWLLPVFAGLQWEAPSWTNTQVEMSLPDYNLSDKQSSAAASVRDTRSRHVIPNPTSPKSVVAYHTEISISRLNSMSKSNT